MARASVMTVDDSAAILTIIAAYLEDSEFKVIASERDGRRAVQKFGEIRPDIVLLDVMMPGMSGYEVCQKIRDNPETRLLPIVLVTALDAAEERIKGIEVAATSPFAAPHVPVSYDMIPATVQMFPLVSILRTTLLMPPSTK